MSTPPKFATVGTQTDSIDVRLSYKIIELFSEGLYASPNKAIEELVANSFDAGAQRVHVLHSSDMHNQKATIVVIDDGEGMDGGGLKQHWLIGISNKRNLSSPPKGRQQIGRFGIGKLATYVLAERLTHITKQKGKFYSTSMDFSAIDKRVENQVEPKSPIKIPLRSLTEAQAKQAVLPWTGTAAFKAGAMPLFGKGAPNSWTVAVMSSLKDKVHEIKPGVLEWVLRTALPLRDDFLINLNGKKLESSKAEKGRIKKWTLGKDLTKLPKPSPKDVEVRENSNVREDDPERFGLYHPKLGLMTGYAEAYKDLLTGKSDELGRSHGFFVYVRGRLVNVADGHFGISPDELRHGSFGRFRLVVHIDGLDDELRSNRETMREGPELETARDILRAIFNAVRPTIEQHDADEAPGAKLARKLAASPSSLSRRPIVELARAVVEGKATAKYLIVPKHKSEAERKQFLDGLEQRAAVATEFITGLVVGSDGSTDDGIAKYDTATGALHINAWHPFVATFYEEFVAKGSRQPLELFAIAEVLLEAHLYGAGVKSDLIEEVLTTRDQLLRNLANESGRQSALAVANALSNARNNPSGLEEKVCAAFRSLGFEVTPIGGKGKPDGVATAHLSADEKGQARRYAISLEAKSKKRDKTKVSAKSVGISTIARQRDEHKCSHAIVVGPAFPTTQGEKSALSTEIQSDRSKSKAVNDPKYITLITIDDLAKLVRLRPIKQIGLLKLRDLFTTCSLPEESCEWINTVGKSKVPKAPYREIINAIHELQKDFNQASVAYDALRVSLSKGQKPLKYDTNQPLVDLCKGMAQMAPGAISASDRTVELDQSPDNVIAAIESATKDYPIEEQ